MPTEITVFGMAFDVERALLIAAAGFTVWAYVSYLVRAWGNTLKPSVAAWIIWGLTTGVEAATYEQVSGDRFQTLVFYLSAALCVLLAFVIFAVARAEKREDLGWTDWACIVVTIAACVIWVYYQNVLWAHLLMVAAVPVSFLPSWLKALRKPLDEHVVPWLLWTVGDFLTGVLIFTRYQGNDIELVYVATELGCHALMFLLVVVGQLAVGLTAFLQSRKRRTEVQF